jgi:Protein of unknown function (DUF1616)
VTVPRLLAFAALASIGAAFGLLFSPLVPLQLVVAVAALTLPGAAVVAALFPNRTLDLWDRVLMSIGTSLAVLVAIGFVLDVTPVGLTTWSWAIALIAITAGAGIIAARRDGLRPGLPGATRHGVIGSLTVLLAFLIVAASGAAAARRAAEVIEPTGTQLWILPAADSRIEAGVRSYDVDGTSYRLEMLIDGVVVQQWELGPMQSGDTWVRDVPLAEPVDTSVELRLWRGGSSSTPYRTVRLEPDVISGTS